MMGTLAALLLVAACSSPDLQSGDAAPAGTPTPTPAATTPSATTAAPSPSSGAAAGSLVLGPDGLAGMKLGMTGQQAMATGLLGEAFENNFDGACSVSSLRAAPADKGTVNLSSTLGIASIAAYAGVKTPEGVQIGTTSADVRRIYPDWKPGDESTTGGRGYAKVPGNTKAVYRIVAVNGAVVELTLQYANQDCYE